MIQFDENGQYQGMTEAEFYTVHDLIQQLQNSGWISALDNADECDRYRARAEAKLTEFAQNFRGLTDAQRTGFLQEYHPRGIRLASLKKFLDALS